MELFILHGAGAISVHNQLSQIKKRFTSLETQTFNGKDFSLGDIITNISSSGLFSEKRLVVIENTDTSLEIAKLPGVADLTLVLVFPKQLIATSVVLKAAKLRGAQILLFTEEKESSVFPLLDLLAEKNPRAMGELTSHLSEWGSQYVLTMIYYLLRRFVVSSANLPPFVMQKMKKQKSNFPLDRVKKMYRLTLETDFKIKQGLTDEKNGLFMLAEKFLL